MRVFTTQWVALAVGVALGVILALVGVLVVRGDGGGRTGGGARTYTLRDGDVVLRREAATRCLASQEGGSPNLFCTRIGRGRHQVVFYEDSVLVWPLALGGDGPPISYRWKARP
jgi:hypothetical protein